MCQHLFIITESKDYNFLYMRWTHILCCVFSYTVFLSFYFSWNSRASKAETGGVAVSEPPQGSVNGPVYHSWNRAFCYRLPVLYGLLQLLFHLMILRFCLCLILYVQLAWLFR